MNTSTILAISGAVIVGIAALPFLLPSSVNVKRTAIVTAEPAAIFALLRSNSGFQTFNPYKDTDPNLKIELSGPNEGVGSKFSFAGKEGKGTQTITALEENKGVTMQIDMGAMGKPVQRFTLTPTTGGTQVTWNVSMDFGMNPIGRVFGLFMDGMMGPVYERGLDNLAKTVTKSA
ncbi:MAG: SRPBCC family protein [Pseudomonadota bacterium]